jgi:serine/threonine-protein kinase
VRRIFTALGKLPGKRAERDASFLAVDRLGTDDAPAGGRWSVPPGQDVLGKFRLVARLGKGGMGEALLAVATGSQGFKKLMVVKRLHERLSDDERMRELFLEEARLAARLSHPNVVQTYEVGCEGATLLMAMEYLEGQNLSRIGRVWPRPVDPRLVARIVSDALAGLHYAHDLQDFNGHPLGIVHRDVSPQNFIVTYDGMVKVLDFGVAKSANQPLVTEAGVLKGKIAYMSPEHFDGPIDRRADVFGVGIVLWELLCGRRLFASESMQRTVHAVLQSQADAPSTIVPSLPGELDDIALRALEKNPANRYQTALEMRQALERYLDDSGPPVRQEDLGALVTTLFQDERTAVQERIRRMMSKDDLEDARTSLPLLVESTTATSNPSQSAFGLIASRADDEEHRRRGRWLVAVGAAGVVSAIAVILGGRARSASVAPIESAPAARAPVESKAAASTAPPASAVTSPPPIETMMAPQSVRAVRVVVPRRAVASSESVTPSAVATSTTSMAPTVSAPAVAAPVPTAAPVEASAADAPPVEASAAAASQSAPPTTPGKRKFRTEF